MKQSERHRPPLAPGLALVVSAVPLGRAGHLRKAETQLAQPPLASVLLELTFLGTNATVELTLLQPLKSDYVLLHRVLLVSLPLTFSPLFPAARNRSECSTSGPLPISFLIHIGRMIDPPSHPLQPIVLDRNFFRTPIRASSGAYVTLSYPCLSPSS